MDLAYLEKRVAELEQMKNQLSANANVVLGQHAEAVNMLKLAKEAAAASDADANATPAAEEPAVME